MLFLLAKHRRHRFAHNIAAAQYHHFSSRYLHLRTHQQFADPGRCAGLKTRRIAEHQFAYVDRMKPIDVFLRQYPRIDSRLSNLRRQRSLNQDPMQPCIGIQTLQKP